MLPPKIANFFAMGDHGLYVWLSYGLCLIVVLLLVWQLRNARSRFVARSRAQTQRAAAADNLAAQESGS